MRKTIIQQPEIKLVGITARTNNQAEFDPTTAQIGATIQKYFVLGVPGQILHRKNPGTTFCVYTEYESDQTGSYTYFIGEEVKKYEEVPAHLVTLTIPAQTYAQFTTPKGTLPEIVIDAWIEIWQMNTDLLGGKRSFMADFEIYDERARDAQKAAIDICIGIQGGLLRK